MSAEDMNDEIIIPDRLRKPGTMSYYKYQYPPLDLEDTPDWGIELPRLWQKYKWNPLFLIASVIWLEVRTRWSWTRIDRYLVTAREEPWHWRLITETEIKYERWKKERAEKAKVAMSNSDS